MKCRYLPIIITAMSMAFMAPCIAQTPGGSVTLLANPTDLGLDGTESNTEIFLVIEQQDATLSLPLGVDIDQPGVYTGASTLVPSTIPAGTVVSSYLLHMDQIGRSGSLTLQGSLTFDDEEIVGLIVSRDALNESDDIVGLDGVTYSHPNVGRHTLEGGPDRIDWSGKNVGFTFFAGSRHSDQMRVITVEDDDEDDDGVLNDDDQCPETKADVVPSPKPNHWYFADGSFIQVPNQGKGKGSGRSFTIQDTGGCSCTQIVEALGLGEGHLKHGCSNGVMDNWVSGSAAKGGPQVNELPETVRLEGNYPNPFNPQTTVRFELPEAASVRLAVYDLLGREVRLLVDGAVSAGTHEVAFDAGGLSSGTYIYRLTTPDGSIVRYMSLSK